MQQLEILLLAGNSIAVEGMERISESLESSGAVHLKHLFLTGNSIDDGGAIALAPALAGMESLEQLDLSHNSIGDDGMRVMTPSFTSLTALQSLHLNKNLFGAIATRAAALSLLGISSLETLVLDVNVKDVDFECQLPRDVVKKGWLPVVQHLHHMDRKGLLPKIKNRDWQEIGGEWSRSGKDERSSRNVMINKQGSSAALKPWNGPGSARAIPETLRRQSTSSGKRPSLAEMRAGSRKGSMTSFREARRTSAFANASASSRSLSPDLSARRNSADSTIRSFEVETEERKRKSWEKAATVALGVALAPLSAMID